MQHAMSEALKQKSIDSQKYVWVQGHKFERRRKILNRETDSGLQGVLSTGFFLDSKAASKKETQTLSLSQVS